MMKLSMRRTLALALLLAGVAGCGGSGVTPNLGAAPLIPSPAAQTPAPASHPEGPRQASAPTSVAPPASDPTLAPPTLTVPLTPTFSTYRDPRGVFSIDVPVNWQTSALPNPNAVGINSVAYNATVIFTLSFSWNAERLSPTTEAQIVEDLKSNILSSYLAQNVQLTGSRDPQDRYMLRGTVTLDGTPTTLEIRVEQTPGGSIVLESWLVPTVLWENFQSLFYQPMMQSLVVDDEALRTLAQ
jgi:hypothetical protein